MGRGGERKGGSEERIGKGGREWEDSKGGRMGVRSGGDGEW